MISIKIETPFAGCDGCTMIKIKREEAKNTLEGEKPQRFVCANADACRNAVERYKKGKGAD